MDGWMDGWMDRQTEEFAYKQTKDVWMTKEIREQMYLIITVISLSLSLANYLCQ